MTEEMTNSFDLLERLCDLPGVAGLGSIDVPGRETGSGILCAGIFRKEWDHRRGTSECRIDEISSMCYMYLIMCHMVT
jgi:hypothetical protein